MSKRQDRAVREGDDFVGAPVWARDSLRRVFGKKRGFSARREQQMAKRIRTRRELRAKQLSKPDDSPGVSFLGRQPVERSPFAMVPREIVIADDISAGDKVLWTALRLFGGKDLFAYPKEEELAAALDMGERTVRRLLGHLEDRGYIHTFFTISEGRRKNCYLLNLEEDRFV